MSKRARTMSSDGLQTVLHATQTQPPDHTVRCWSRRARPQRNQCHGLRPTNLARHPPQPHQRTSTLATPEPTRRRPPDHAVSASNDCQPADTERRTIRQQHVVHTSRPLPASGNTASTRRCRRMVRRPQPKSHGANARSAKAKATSAATGRRNKYRCSCWHARPVTRQTSHGSTGRTPTTQTTIQVRRSLRPRSCTTVANLMP